MSARQATMLTEPELLPPETQATDIALAVQSNPGIVLLDTAKFDAFYDKWKAKADALTPDTSTAKGRDEIRSLAANLAREKVAIDKARLSMTSDWRSMTDQANEAGKVIKSRLEALGDEIRAPLTKWEEAEKARADKCSAIIASLRSAAIVEIGDTADEIRQRGMNVWATVLDAFMFGETLSEAQATKDSTVATLKRALDRLTKEEADRAELEKLRADAIERERVEAEKAAAEQRERDRVEAERVAAEVKAAAAKTESARIAAAQETAAEEARRATAFAAQIEIDAANERAAKVERERQAEVDQQAKAKAEADAEAKRLADEQAEREANKAHRARVKTAAKQAIMTCGVSEDAAQKIVLAIIAGEIPAVTLRF